MCRHVHILLLGFIGLRSRVDETADPDCSTTEVILCLLIGVLKGSWDLVTRVIIRVTILITPIKVLITYNLSY